MNSKPVWLKQPEVSIVSIIIIIIIIIAPSPPAPASAVQRVWDNQCCEVQADQLLDAASDHVERARSRAPAGSGDWLHTLPLSSIGLKMDNATVRIAVGLRLDAPIVRPHVYVYMRN